MVDTPLEQSIWSGLTPRQKQKFLRQEREFQLARQIIAEASNGVKLVVSHPIGAWLAGKLFLKGVVDPLKIGDDNTRAGINQAFDALTVAYVAVNITGQALPLITTIAGLESGLPRIAAATGL